MAGTNKNPVSVTIKNLDKVNRYLSGQEKAGDKALKTAVKVEGFRLRNLLKKELKSGRPGGRRLTPLSFIARRLDRVIKTGGGTTARQSPNRSPLARLAMGVNYNASDPNAVKVGWVAPPGRPGNWEQGTWRELAKKHQKGFSTPVSESLRERIARKGGALGKIEDGQVPFFLKKETRQFDTPARPILRPFWIKRQRRAASNIARNFKLKLAGQRI